MRATTLLATLSLGLVACVGGIDGATVTPDSGGTPIDAGSDTTIGPPLGTGSDTTGGGSATARDYFNANVYGLLSSTCGSSSCHNSNTPGANAPPFVNPTTPLTDDSAAWTTITGQVSVVGSFGPSVPLLTIPKGGHYASFNANQVASITSWLALESGWRSAAGSGEMTVDYMAKFSGCMQYTDFVTAGVAKAYADQVETSQGYCENCHVNGQASSYMIATPDSANMFGAMTTYREYMSTFFTLDTGAGSGSGSGSAAGSGNADQVIVNTIPFVLAADGGVNGEHPVNWNPTNNKGMTAVTQFYMLTLAHMNGTTAPACGPSTLTD